MSQRTNQFLSTLRTNWRDILACVAVVVLFNLLADWIVYRSAETDQDTWLVGVVATLQGFAKFTAANLCMWLFGVAVAWPTMNAWSNASFGDAWREASNHTRLVLFCAVACAEGVMAALCFAQ